MSGPAAPYCAFSDTTNVVLVCHPVPEVTNADFDAALHRAKLKAAVYLARSTSDLTPRSDPIVCQPSPLICLESSLWINCISKD